MRHWPQGDEPHKTSLALLPAAEHRSRRHRPLAQTTRLRLMKRIFSPVPKKRYRNRAGVLKKPCSCLREAASAKAGRHLWKLATCVFRQNGNAPKVKSSSNPNFSNNPQLQGFGSTPARVRYCNIWVFFHGLN